MHFSNFNLIYWIPICGKYFLEGSFLEKCGKIWKTAVFSGRLWPDWGNTAQAAMAGLGSIGVQSFNHSRTSRTKSEARIYTSFMDVNLGNEYKINNNILCNISG